MTAAHAQAAALMRKQRYADAVPLLIDACAAAEAGWRSWVDLGACFMALGNAPAFFRFLELRHARADDGLRLFHDCLTSALSWPDLAPLRHMIAVTPHGTPYFAIALYIAGVMSCGDDARHGIVQTKAAAQVAQEFAAQFEGDPQLCTILHEGAVLEDFETVAALEAADRRALIAASGSIEPAASFGPPPAAPVDAPFVFLSSCDECYLDRFGATVAQALDRTGVRTIYHLHVVDPTPAVGAKIAGIQARCRSLDVRYSTETYGRSQQGYARASFYACARLVRMPEIVARYGRDVMMWDMDTEGVADLAALVAAMRAADLGYFEMKKTRPSLICHLAAVYFSNTAATRRCVELIAKYAVMKLERTPYWLLDQASVFCVSRYLHAAGALRLNDFSTTPGGSFESHVAVAASAPEKQAMRELAGCA